MLLTRGSSRAVPYTYRRRAPVCDAVQILIQRSVRGCPARVWPREPSPLLRLRLWLVLVCMMRGTRVFAAASRSGAQQRRAGHAAMMRARQLEAEPLAA